MEREAAILRFSAVFTEAQVVAANAEWKLLLPDVRHLKSKTSGALNRNNRRRMNSIY